MTAPQHADDFTELTDADIPRVDLVDKAANGTRFLIAKSAEDGLLKPLIPADMVRGLIEKAQEADVTTPAPDDVAKDAPPVETDDLIETAPGGGTAESLPGSPDWEQLDGDTAMNAVATLARVKACLGWLSDREAQEAVTGGDPDSDGNSWDLDSMACQIDYIIGCLAGFAVGEHLEAGMADELEAVGKAAAAMAEPLAVVEKLAPIRKAGRVLSSANESAIRTAVDSLTAVLNSLPQAPAVDDTAVTKTEETTVTEPTAPEAAEPVDVLAKALAALPHLDAAAVAETLLAGGRTQDVAKAAGDPQLAVFDANGKLIGTVDPSKLSPIATSPAEADKPADAEPAADDTPAEPAAETPAEPAAPAAVPDEKVIPGTQTVQAPAPEDDQTPAVAKAVAAALKEAFAPFAEQIGQSADLAKAVGDLKERVEKMGQQPDNRRSPVLNGATGTPGAVTRDGDSPDVSELRKAIEAETDPTKKLALQKQAFFDEVKARFTA